ncbi:MAG: phosphopantetheine-binding protein [Bacillota bacterium]|nr:phosphopantetheine-binding protein [Bacillota bacterium]
MEALELIRKVIFETTGKKDITYDTDFIRDLELNSFDIMNIICAFENLFDVSIPTRDVWQLHQVKDVIEYIEKSGVSLP